MNSARRNRLVMLGVATACMVVASWYAFHSVTQLKNARASHAAARSELSNLRALMPTVEQHERYAQEQAKIAQMVEQSGFDPASWTNRKVQRPASIVPRAEAEALLQQQIGVSAYQWFAADHFDVAVITPTAGLFSPAQKDDRGFSLEMTGVVYFPMVSR
ncbi:hypothetical protein [Hydrogenophaga sp. 5NK40-0174]|uniref:hypothetical protein n=1 Tax=Hydrogenophaga sp. 5NK40-0174 TaxID=3127649 RepID=UPI003105C579